MTLIQMEPGFNWTTSTSAAKYLGITTEGLKTRRRREGTTHPRHIVAGSVVLYSIPELEVYAKSWSDGRRG